MFLRPGRRDAFSILCAGLFGLAMLAGSADRAQAVPSFARQTGLACEACHTVFPQLTPFGRVFKASGYTLSNTSKVQDVDRMKHYLMTLSDVPPISVMGVASTSSANKASDANSSKTSTDFPQQLSIFYAGAIADNVGGFLQVTYEGQSGGFGMDNADIRFADVATLYNHSVIYGISLNNNPTVQDLWNSTPAWGQPFLGSPTMAGPAAAARIEGAMAQAVAGVSAYAFVDQSLYGEVGVYRSALQGASVSNIGGGTPPTDVITGVAPYWRFAYEYDWGQQSLELGTFGLQAALHNPTTIAGGSFAQSLQSGPTDRFTDIGIDTQYQYIDDDNQVTATARAIRENQRLDASFAQTLSDNPSNRIDTMNATLSYFWRRKLGATIGLFNVDGSTDVTYFGSPNGKPNSSWGNVEVDYLPWLNVKLGLQYTAYTKFNGASNNYDGNGRNASDNNMIFGYVWFAY
ncbi:MAG: cytochrome C [Pseudomonadota bacterium]